MAETVRETSWASAAIQDELTERKLACPTCGQPMLGARGYDTQAQDAFIGVACLPCDQLYRVRDLA